VLILILGFVICLSTQAWARIGETEAQLIERYGPIVSRGNSPQNHAAPTYIEFKKDIFTIDVWLLNGVSAQESINKSDNLAYLSDANIETLRTANTEGHVWKRTGKAFWLRDDGVAARVVAGTIAALGSPGYIYFVVTTKEMVEASKTAEASAKKAADGNLQGF